jgi:hypothetical protein
MQCHAGLPLSLLVLGFDAGLTSIREHIAEVWVRKRITAATSPATRLDVIRRVRQGGQVRCDGIATIADLLPIRDSVAVSVGVGPTGAIPKLFAIPEPVAVAIDIVRITTVGCLVRIGEPITVRVEDVGMRRDIQFRSDAWLLGCTRRSAEHARDQDETRDHGDAQAEAGNGPTSAGEETARHRMPPS